MQNNTKNIAKKNLEQKSLLGMNSPTFSACHEDLSRNGCRYWTLMKFFSIEIYSARITLFGLNYQGTNEIAERTGPGWGKGY